MVLRISPAPHMHAKTNTRSLMLDVIIALLPTAAAGIYIFGANAALTLAISTVSAVLTELIYQLIRRQELRVNDLSAVVTGLILGLNLPSSAPWWLPVIGSALAIIIVKQLFGGLGDNFMNPAMAARGILLASWSLRMTTFNVPSYFTGVDAVAEATPLVLDPAKMSSVLDLFLGRIPGSIGEVCKAAILVGLVYLLIRKVISWRIPVVMLGTVALFTWIFSDNPVIALFSGGNMTGEILVQSLSAPVHALLTGGVMFGAVFMATDYSTSPMTNKGQIIYAAIIGFIVVILRRFGTYPEGVTYAILLGNIAAPLIDKYAKQRVYGEVKGNA